MKPEAILRIAMPRQILRASIGLHIDRSLPPIRELQAMHGLGKSAACGWHSKLVKARREFCQPQKAES